MDEVETQGVEQEIVQELANPETESAQEDAAPQEAIQQESRNDRNWRELRRAKEDAERKVRMQDELLQRLMTQQMQPHPAQVAPPEEDIIHEISREEYVPGDKVAKGLRKIEEKFDRRVQEIEKRYEDKHKSSLINDLKREFSDFEQVVNPETLAILDETNPRLASAIASSNDPYLMAVQSYEYIKAKGIHSKAAPSKRTQETERKIEQNKKTVQTPQAFDKRPMAQAFQMTDGMKKEIQREMYHYAQQAGMGY